MAKTRTSAARKAAEAHDVATCMCDKCIKERARARIAERETTGKKERPRLRAVPKPMVAQPQEAELRPLTVEDLPFKALVWFLIVEPRQPKGKIGRIVTPDQAKEVEAIQTTIGRIIHKGALFGAGKSTSGVALNDDPLMAALKPGDHILFARYTGQIVKIQVEGRERKVIILTDTELMCVVSDPDRIRFWL